MLRGVTSVGANFLKPGTIKMNNIGYTAIEKSWKSKEIAENFSKCGLKAYVSKNINEDIWKKLFMNCVLNPITGIFRIKNYEIEDEKLKPLRDEIIKECLSVAKKDGFNFSFKFVEKIIDRVRKSKNYSSMYQDLSKGKRTEIDYLNGAVVRLGKKYGIKCPVNESLVGMIKFLEART